MKQIWLTFFSCLLKPQWKSDLYFQPMHECAFRNIDHAGFYFILMINVLPQNPHKQTNPLSTYKMKYDMLWNTVEHMILQQGKFLNNFLVFWTSSYSLSPFLKKNLKQTAWSFTNLSGKSAIYSKIPFLITFWENMKNTRILRKRKNKLSHNLKTYRFLGWPTYDFDYDS